MFAGLVPVIEEGAGAGHGDTGSFEQDLHGVPVGSLDNGQNPGGTYLRQPHHTLAIVGQAAGSNICAEI